MPLLLIQAEHEFRPVIERLIQLYLHDISEYLGTEPNDEGYYFFPELDSYWSQEGRQAFLIQLQDRPAGFVLMQGHTDKLGRRHWQVDDFFIVRNYRGLGIGEEVARMVFDQFAGHWHIEVSDENDVGVSFWRQVLRRYTLRRCKEFRASDNRGTAFEFVSPSPDALGGA